MRKNIFFVLFLVLPILFFVSCDDGTIDDIINDDEGEGTPDATWIELMESGEYESALTILEGDITDGSRAPEDLLYASLLNLATMSTSDESSTIMANAGFADYPSNINDMLNMTMPMTEFEVVTGWYHDEELGEDVDITSIISMPKVVDHSGNEVTDYGLYMSTILENLLYAYPNGFDTPVRNMIAVYNRVLPKAIGYLDTLSGLDSIEITKAMAGIGYDDIDEVWLKDEYGADVTFLIGKAEVLGMISVFEILAGIMNYVGSVDYSFPVKAVYDYFMTSTGDEDLPDIPLAPGGTLLQAADDASAYLADSKMYIVSALTHVDEAIELIAARTGSDFVISPGLMGLTSWADNDVDDVFSAVRILIDKIKTSINDGTTAYIPLDLFTATDTDNDGYADTSNFINYATESAWPVAAEWGFPEAAPSVLALNLEALFENPIIAIDTYFAVDDTTGEPTIFDISDIDGSGPTEITSFSVEDFNADKPATDYAFRLNDYTLGGLIQDPPDTDAYASIFQAMLGLPEGFLTYTVDDGTSIYFSVDTKDFYYSMFNTPGDEFDSDLDGTAMYAMGSFWYHLMRYGSVYTATEVAGPTQGY